MHTTNILIKDENMRRVEKDNIREALRNVAILGGLSWKKRGKERIRTGRRLKKMRSNNQKAS